MRKSNWVMKLLILLPVFLLAGLLVWVAVDQWRVGGKPAVEIPKTEAMATTAETRLENSGETQEEMTEKVTQEPLTEPVAESEPASEPVILLFAGDILLSGHVINAYEKAGGIHGVLDQSFLNRIAGVDAFIANEEFPFSDQGTAAEDKEYTFRLPTARVSIFNEIGLDIVTLANNHALDFGKEALVDTCNVLDAAGILHVGAGANMEQARRPVNLEIKGKRITFLGASRVFPDYSWVAGSNTPGMVSAYDPGLLIKDIKKARETCDFLVVYVHWGKEKAEMPEEYQRTLGRQLIDAGADLVVGSHPHVLQGLEYYNGKPIVYSLGNFIFGSRIPQTALLQVRLEEEGPILSVIPGTSGAGYTKEVTENTKVQEFYRNMERLSFGVQIDENGVVTPVE